MVDVLCCDKTGTLTQNELVVSAVRPVKRGYDEADVLGFAALPARGKARTRSIPSSGRRLPSAKVFPARRRPLRASRRSIRL